MVCNKLQRTFCAFNILKPDASGMKRFNTTRQARDVAAWVRHVTGEVCAGWDDVASFVHGHNPQDCQKQAKGDKADVRLMFLPLPTINPALNRVESIQRVMIAAPPDYKNRVDFIRRRLAGLDLVWHNKPVGLLNILPTNDWVLNQFTGKSKTWSTVTPVVWPGHDDHNRQKAEGILRKAFIQSGFHQDLIEELQWNHIGFKAGVDLASRYQRPSLMNGPVYHVRVRFSQPVPGPIAVGAGRYRGFGLFASEIPLS